ncbi:DUF6232 family protein [Streptomyces sp. NPDC059818]|uniref:DUF6232 family protein n=1 Tax=unclassified Streptomyces TaxID=2593676 RepID=UPI003667958C
MDETGPVNTPLPEPPPLPPPRPPVPPMPPQALPVHPGSVVPGHLQNPGESNQPHRKGDPLVLKVSRRTLWVGPAAVPLHNITWVDAFRLKHDWSRVFSTLVQWLIVVVPVFGAINFPNDSAFRQRLSGSFVLIAVPVFLVLAIKDLIASAKPVLVVVMNSGARVVVTLKSMDELQQIAGQIVYAIDHPEAEFTAIVRQFNNSTNNYGPVVNMNDGRGNTGFKL